MNIQYIVTSFVLVSGLLFSFVTPVWAERYVGPGFPQALLRELPAEFVTVACRKTL